MSFSEPVGVNGVFKGKLIHFECSLCLSAFLHFPVAPTQTAHRGPSAKQESQSDASNPASAPANAAGPSDLKSKSSGKPDNSDGEDWGREQEEEEEEEDDDDDDADEDYEAPGGHSTSAGGSSHPSAQTEWTCPQCQTTFTDNEDYLSHVKMEHGKVGQSARIIYFNLIVLSPVGRHFMENDLIVDGKHPHSEGGHC